MKRQISFGHSLLTSIIGCVVAAVMPAGMVECLAQTTPPPVQLKGPIESPSTGQSEAGDITDDIANDTKTFDPDRLSLSRPELKGLVSISDKLNPFNLDAREPMRLSLKDVLNFCIERNLDIGIARDRRSAQGWRYASSVGRFLPNAKLAFNYNYLTGEINLPIGPSPDPLRFNNPFILTSAGFTYFGYRGGSVLFGALRERNSYRATRFEERATISDALREAFEQYYNLMLEEAILRIRIKALEVSEEQVRLNRELFEAGSATQLDVMQAQTQLSRDRQDLIDQQVKRRNAAIELSAFLDLPQDVDVLPTSLSLAKCRLVDETAEIGRLIATAMVSRPELKQKEQQRLAARKEIVVAAAPLQPTVKLDSNVFGVGETLNRELETVTTRTTVLAPGGGTVTVPQTRTVNKQISALYQIGLSVNWNFEGLGTRDAALTQSARVEARKALLEQRKEVNKVTSEVRKSYLDVLRTDRQIQEALTRLRSAQEELMLSRLRYENGVGKNIDILRAQQDYTDALIRKATAIVNYNIAQSNLLRDIGTISVASLTANQGLKVK